MKNKIFSILLVIILCISLFPTISFADYSKNTLPEYYFTECPEQGTIKEYEYKKDEVLKVWTPYNYDNSINYEIILLMHGDGGNLNSWLTKTYNLFGKDIQGRYIFDWITYEKLVVPFIVVTLNNKPKNPHEMSNDIIDALLYIADHYNVYPTASMNSLIKNKKHITIGGLSRGSILTHWFIRYYPELASNLICMSAAGPYKEAAEKLDKQNIKILKLFTAVGINDEKHYEDTRKSYKVLKPYAEESIYLEYRYDHSWCVWMPGIYEAIKYILPEETITFRITNTIINIRTKILGE